MDREIPGIIERSEPLSKEEEKAEIFSRAFLIASGTYFENQVRYEDGIREGLKTKKDGVNIMIASAVIGMALVLAGILTVALLVFGLASLVGGVLYGYFLKYKKGEEQIDNFTRQLRALVPDKRISFVSKLYYPFYIVPYSTGSMVFDGMSQGESIDIDLVNLQVEKIESAITNLKNEKKRFDDVVAQENTMSPSDVQEYSGNIINEKMLEQDILDSASDVENSTADDMWVRDIRTVNIHKPDGIVANGIEELFPISYDAALLPTIETSLDIATAEDTISEMKGVATEALGGDILGVANSWRSEVVDLIRPLEISLERNVDTINAHYHSLTDMIDKTIHRQVCTHCLSDWKKKKDWEVRYDLEKTILEMFYSSIDLMSADRKCDTCGNKIEEAERDLRRCECGEMRDVREPVGGSPLLRARAVIMDEIDADLLRIPVDEDKTRALRFPIGAKYFTSQLGWNDDYWECGNPDHGHVEPTTLEFYDEVFAHTGDRLWEEMKQPILEKANEANRHAVRNRQKLSDHKLSLLPYEQVFTQLEMEMNKLEMAHEEAQRVLSALRR